MRPGRKLTKADLFLKLLEMAFPDGVPTAEAARLLYGSDSREARERVRDLARTLRKWGFHAYSVRGIYYLCNDNPQKFVAATQFREPLTVGDLVGFVHMMFEARASDPTGNYREELKGMASAIAAKLRDLAAKLEAAFA